jgi:hypothetical protein
MICHICYHSMHCFQTLKYSQNCISGLKHKYLCPEYSPAQFSGISLMAIVIPGLVQNEDSIYNNQGHTVTQSDQKWTCSICALNH